MRRPLLVALCLTIQAPSLAAQWRLGIELGADQTGPFARRSPGAAQEPADARPTTTWPAVVRVGWGGDGHRVALAGWRSRPGLEMIGTDFVVALHPAFEVLTIAPELSTRLVRLHGGAALRGALVLPVERWAFPTAEDPPRWRPGAAVQFAVEAPVGSRAVLRVAAGTGTVLRHPLSDLDLLANMETTPLWRQYLRVGFEWRIGGPGGG